MRPRLTLARHASADAFLGEAGPFLTAREAEHNLPLGIAATVREHPEIYRETVYFATVRDAAAVVLAALRTPPWNLVLSEVDVPEAIDVLIADLAERAPGLPGVTGPNDAAGRFAERWTARTGRRAVLDMRERIFRLTRVVAPPTPPGRWRCAAERDARLIADWIGAFSDEAVPNEPRPPDIDATVARWIQRVGRTMYLWEVGDEVVSMVGVGSPTPHGIRVGPVYTPPEQRGHGFASALTAAASQDQLDAGRTFCFLYTDLANPTSNHIYQAIGYEPVSDADMYRFVDG